MEKEKWSTNYFTARKIEARTEETTRLNCARIFQATRTMGS